MVILKEVAWKFSFYLTFKYKIFIIPKFNQYFTLTLILFHS